MYLYWFQKWVHRKSLAGKHRPTPRSRGLARKPQVEGLEDRRLLTAGALDVTFGTGGTALVDVAGGNDQAAAVAIQGDGKLVLAGTAFNSSNNTNDFALVRLNANGSLDTTFGTNGKATADFAGAGASATTDQASAVALQSDGKIVVVGSSGADFAVARFNANGSLDTTFGTEIGRAHV